MLKFLFFASFLIVFNYCDCQKNSLTNDEIDNGFTIVLPRQETYLLLQCYLQIAKNDETKSDFRPAIDIKKTIKNRDGMEYVHNYYQTGNDDSCTFRVYPNILNEISDIFQMRYWYVIMNNRIQEEAVVDFALEAEWDIQTSLFYMNSWSWWKEHRVNTLILQFANPFVPWTLSGDLKYIYVDRKFENAFTIVLPQEKESESLSCFLKIAANRTITEEFNADNGRNIKDTNKYNDGMEYIGNYHKSGKDDSCTFRFYPKILDKLSNGHDKYQMRYWKITTYIKKKEGIAKKILQFHMDSWASWTNTDYTVPLKKEH